MDNTPNPPVPEDDPKEETIIRFRPGDTIRIDDFAYEVRKIVRKDVVIRPKVVDGRRPPGPAKVGHILKISLGRYLIRKVTKKDLFLRLMPLKEI